MKIVKQRILAGFLNRNETLNQAQGLTAAGHNITSKRQFWRDYQQARNFRAQMPVTPIPAPLLTPLSKKAKSHIKAVESTDAFQENFGGLQYEFQNVNLEALQPTQIFTNVDLKHKPPSANNLQALLDYCLPVDPTIPAEVMITATGIRFSTDRYGMGPQNLSRRIQGNKIVLCLEHPNLLHVCYFTPSNRLIICNGNHRALELLMAGHTIAPALVLYFSDFAELAQRVPQGLGLWNLDFQINNPRPPLISDFLSPLAIKCSCVLVPSIVEMHLDLPK